MLTVTCEECGLKEEYPNIDRALKHGWTSIRKDNETKELCPEHATGQRAAQLLRGE